VNWHQNLHEKYGDVVRIAPNELSYINPRAWEDIYGRMTNDNGLHIKDMRFFSNVDGEERSLIVINDESEHARVRRIFSPAFSDSALKKQEPMFQKHAESMIQMIHQKVDNDAQQKFDMVKVYNFTTFDIMGELAFGSSLNQLETGHYSLWVKSIFDNMKSAALFSILEYHQPLARLARMIIGPFFRKLEEAHDKFSADHVDRRLAGQVDKPDIWQLVLSQSEQNLLCRKEMHANASLFMLAGSETTATLLSGLIYYLLTYPHTHRNLCQEIRSAFKNPEEISFESLTSLEYLNACIQEGLRMYPPVPVGIPRVSPKGGTVVCGKWVPPKVSATIWILSALRDVPS
jgi:cytochrome P450